MEKSGKGLKVDVYDIIDYVKFDAERKTCLYHHIFYGPDDDIGYSHCTKNSKEKYVEGESSHRQCGDCMPGNCIFSERIKECIRSNTELIRHMVKEKTGDMKGCNDEINRAMNSIKEAKKELAESRRELTDIVNSKFDYSNPEVKKVLELAK